jgi:spermidine synthase
MTIRAGALIAGLSGFIALSYEILWYRMFSVASGGTAPAFAFVLGAYLYGLAAGGFLVRSWSRSAAGTDRRRNALMVSGFVLGANAVGYAVLPMLGGACSVGACFAALGGVAVAAALLGAILPLVCHAAIEPNQDAGLHMSRFYAANIVGSVAGTLFTGYTLLEYLPAKTIAAALLFAGIGVALIPLVTQRARSRDAVWLGGAAVMVAAALVSIARPVIGSLYERLIFRENYHSGLTFAQTVENRVGVINVTSTGKVFGGGAYDGYARVDLMQDRNLLFRVAAIPGIHKTPRRALMIGLATGAWAQVIAALPGIEQLTIVEINPGYLRLIPQYPDVASLLHNPKVRIVIDDGRRWLARNPTARFDLIAANVTLHWREHATNLLSKEFLELIRSRLEPGGIYFYNATSSPEAFQTGLAVFPHAIRVLNSIAVSDRPLRFDPDAFAATLSTARIDGRPLLDAADSEQQQRIQDLVTWVTGPATAESRAVIDAPTIIESEATLRRRLGAARVITDDNMAVEWSTISATAEHP